MIKATATATITEQMQNMRVGDALVYPIEKFQSIRVLACNAGMLLNRRYCTRTDRETRTVTVTRVE